MRDLAIFIIIIFVLYLFQSVYSNEYRIMQLEKEIGILNEKNNQLKRELSRYKIRKVNWYGQYEEQYKEQSEE